MANYASVLARPVLVCEECRRPWLEPPERWRLFLTDDEPPEAVPYCPSCAGREFDGD
jgi:hypothetical protein